MTRRAANSNRSIEPRGLSRDDAAAYVGIGTTLFDRLVATGKMPKCVRLDGRILWDRRQLDRTMDGLFEETDENDRWSKVA